MGDHNRRGERDSRRTAVVLMPTANHLNSSFQLPPISTQVVVLEQNQLEEIVVSDRTTFRKSDRIFFVLPRASQQTTGTTGDLSWDMREGRFCATLLQVACKSLILKRRDVRVV
jgi:hypothetical protein